MVEHPPSKPPSEIPKKNKIIQVSKEVSRNFFFFSIAELWNEWDDKFDGIFNNFEGTQIKIHKSETAVSVF